MGEKPSPFSRRTGSPPQRLADKFASLRPRERDFRFASTSEDFSLLIVSGYVTKGQGGKGLSAPACACPYADRYIAQAGTKKK